MTQKFKGDVQELQFEAAGKPAFDLCGTALDSFLAAAYQTADYLLALYDEGRMPFSDRVPRATFVSFIRQAIPNFPLTGTFEAYIFILRAIFGGNDETTVLFDVPGPGKIEITVNAADIQTFTWLVHEFSGGGYEDFVMLTSDGDDLQFQGLSGISSQAQIDALLAELIPAGIFPDVILQVYTLFDFVTDTDDFILDSNDNQIVFFEIGA